MDTSLQFGNVRRAFDAGDPTKRKEPLSVRIPPDGVPREPRGVWVQLLKTINGLADGRREWKNCFLAAARGLGVRDIRLGTVCFGLEGTHNKNTMASLGWPSTILLVKEMKSGSKQSSS